jgi:hypothetical protein
METLAIERPSGRAYEAERTRMQNYSTSRSTKRRKLPLSKRAIGSGRLQNEKLCARCANIDLDTVFSKPDRKRRGTLVRNLGPIAGWQVDSCSLCRFLATLLPQSLRQRRDVKFALRSSSSTRTLWMGWDLIDTFMITLEARHTDHSSGFLVAKPGDESTIRLLKRSSIDFEVLTNWLRFCQNSHTKTCTTKTSPLPFLKLIDCERHIIVPALDRTYATLSYVWGEDAGTIEYSESLPEDLPCTIEDALTVTRQLGLRYLWVDRYCINQQCEEEKSTQLQAMDLIYKNSEVTIIAAAGQDPSYGLPGVGRQHRSGPVYPRIGTHTLVSALKGPTYLINSSKWITRAWTFQEALLSRRRVVFTDEQVYYECYGMCCCEVLDVPLRELHTKNMQRFRKRYCNGQKIGIFPRGVGTAPWEVLHRIEEYSDKFLTKESDILKGMLGIFSAFKSNDNSASHFWGVPLLSQPSKREGDIDLFQTSSVGGLLLGMCWDLKNPSTKRRPGFPSWSWTGWFGSVRWKDCMASESRERWWKTSEGWSPFQVDREIRVRLELSDGRMLDVKRFQQSYGNLDQLTKCSNFIHVSAWTSQIQILGCNRNCVGGRIECEAKINLEDGGYLRWRFHPTTTEDLQKKSSCAIIHLIPGSPEGEFHGPTGPAVIVVCRVEDHMERVGFGWINQRNYDLYDSKGVWEFANEDEPPLLVNPMYARRPKLARSWQDIRLG